METLKEQITQNKDYWQIIEDLNKRFPDLRTHTDRWGNKYYCTKKVNNLVNQVTLKHNCGCCDDSPLEAWPYITINEQNIYSDPPSFFVGERIPYYEDDNDDEDSGFYGTDKANDNWKEKLIETNISSYVIQEIQEFFNNHDPNMKKDLENKGIFKSKWGYHPCDKETFQQLKKLNYWLLLAKKKAANWNRWNRKDIKYQIKTEPEICSIFSKIYNSSDLKRGIDTNRIMFNKTQNSFWIKSNIKNNYIINLDYNIEYDYKNKKVLNGKIYRYIPEKHGKFIEINTYGIQQAYQNAKIPKKTPEEVIPLELNKENILLLYLSAKKLYK